MIVHNVFPTRRAGKRVGWTFVSDPGDGQECPSYSRDRVGWAKSWRPTRSTRNQSVGREDLAHPTRNGRRRAAFTLTELLVVIMVIGILASSVLFALYGAIQDAKVKRTKAQATKLHDMLMTRWESYRTRPVRLLMTSPLPGIPASAASPVTPPRVLRRNAKPMAGARLNALRDLMRMEMPDRKTDVLDGPVSYSFVYPDSQAQPQTATVTIRRPAISREYLRRARAVYNNGVWTAPNWSVTFQDAECLYMIVASIRDITSNGLDFVREGEIGDLDGDGMPEILDAWGKPIVFIRWPAGFLAHPGPDYIYGTVDDIPSYSTIQSFVVDGTDYVESEDRDPFDPLRVDNRQGVAMPNAGSVSGTAKYYFNYKTYPLVCSGGPDELWDIVRFDFDPAGDPSIPIRFDYYRSVDPSSPPANYQGVINDPYSILPTSGRRLGEPFLNSSGYVDNITNHGLGD